MKQLVLSCPQEYYESLLCPLLGPLFVYMLQVKTLFQLDSQMKIAQSWGNAVCNASRLLSFNFNLNVLTMCNLNLLTETQLKMAGHQSAE